MIKIKLLITSLTLFLSGNVIGQNTFALKNSSKNYNAEITVENCEDQSCNGKSQIKLMNKSGKLLQTFNSEDLYLDLNPNKTVLEKVDLFSPLIFNDFNFDGSEDLAIRNGNNSGYGGPSYDVYVYNITKKQFVLSKELTELASTNFGMFEVDKKRKRLITFNKSGATMHWTTEYEVVPKKGLVKVYEIEEDAQGGEFVIVTEKKLISGKWIKKTTKHKIKDYYKD